MQIFPAVDIRGGLCVRLIQGDFTREQVYHDDPLLCALEWLRQGAERIHVVDLDGARGLASANRDVIRSMVTAGIPLQLGGGIRSYEAAVEWLEWGVERIILGTVAVREPDLRLRLIQDYGERIIIGVDSRDDEVAVSGWEEMTSLPVEEFCRVLRDEGVGRIILTDIGRDGTLEGPNVALLRQMLTLDISVIASGGVGTRGHLTDLRRLSQEFPHLEGVIVGKALYDGRFTLSEALDLLQEVD